MILEDPLPKRLPVRRPRGWGKGGWGVAACEHEDVGPTWGPLEDEEDSSYGGLYRAEVTA